MGQKVHPLGFRLGVYEDWHSHWFAKKSLFGKVVMDDLAIRALLKNSLNSSHVGKIVLDRAGDSIRVTIFSSKPGLIIGKRGQGIGEIKKSVYNLVKKNVEIFVKEIDNADANARLIAKSICEQIERRVGFKRVMKKAAHSVMKTGARGIRICCAGRLGGAEIARSEWIRLGSVPLHTLRADIQYALEEAKTTYGMIGVKVWLCRGMG